jgi:hypothetical protein
MPDNFIFTMESRTYISRRCAFCYAYTECVEMGTMAFFNLGLQITICRNCSKMILKNIEQGWNATGLPLEGSNDQS